MTSYNQSAQAQSVRVGNWFEELKLQEDTGIRYYADPRNRKTSLLTQSRCIEHSDKIKPKDYTTVTRSTLVNPLSHPNGRECYNHGGGSSFNPNNGLGASSSGSVGPRRRLQEETIKKQIEEELAKKSTNDYEESRRLSYRTLAKDSFVSTKPDFHPSLKEGDVNLRLPTRNTNYSSDSAVTIYSHAVIDPKQKVNFPTSYVGSSNNPFRKNCYFSADIRSNANTIRTETEERPNPLPTVEQFKILTFFAKRLLTLIQNELTHDRKHKSSDASTGNGLVPGSCTRFLLNIFSSLEEIDSVSLEEFENLLSSSLSSPFRISYEERKALLAAFDAFSQQTIVISDFLKFIKRTPIPRRLELIDYFFSFLQPDSASNMVSLPELKRRMDASYSSKSKKGYAKDFLVYIETTINGFDEFSIHDFFDYHIEASQEIENDDEFEAFMVDSWSFLSSPSTLNFHSN
jgi:hypothetical protein